MNKAELVAKAAENAEMTKKDTSAVIEALIDIITDALANNDKVQLVGFGTFEVRERGERLGKNPRTGEEIVIPAAKIPAFKAGKALKDKLAK